MIILLSLLYTPNSPLPIILPFPLPKFLPCYQPTLTRRTGGPCPQTSLTPPPNNKCSASYCTPFSFSVIFWARRALAQAVGRRPVTANAQVRSQGSTCEIWGGKRGVGTDFSPAISVLTIIPPVHHTSSVRLPSRTNVRSLRVCQKMLFRKSGIME